MKICGLQKLTLLDFPEKIACIVFTGGCNFRCPFCHNASLVYDKDSLHVDEDEFFAFLKSRKGLLEGVCVTGGEPLLNHDIEEFLKKVKTEGFLVKLDTNGSFPDELKSLTDKGLIDYIAMDIKNSPEKYPISSGVAADIDSIKKSAAFIMSSSVPYEFRTTAVKEFNSYKDAEAIGKWLEGANKYRLQYFKPSDSVIQKGLTPLSDDEMNEMKNILSRH
ncbi:MAG: anaerobic ribonucleoside-triphosphate reductase activating protein, partial [Clostridiales bacterium]|nr:anaerobic ribonucleoside-triphosphate reductase activating protein [Clostridiales bacterium]